MIRRFLSTIFSSRVVLPPSGLYYDNISGTAGEAITPTSPTISGTAPFVFTVSGESVPLGEGLTLNSSTGQISGTPAFGAYLLTIVATNSAGSTEYELYVDIAVAPPYSEYALSFDGVDESVTVADHSTFDLVSALTVSAWVKAPAGGEAGIVAKADYGNIANNREWFMARDYRGSGSMGVYLSIPGLENAKDYRTSVVVFDDAWHHVAFTYAANVLKLYVDGVQDTGAIVTSDGAMTDIKNSTNPITFGALMQNGTPNLLLDGLLDDISIWGAALTAAEIAEIYNGGAPADLTDHTQYAALAEFWKMGDGDTIAANGIIGRKNARHATPTNMTSGNIVSR